MLGKCAVSWQSSCNAASWQKHGFLPGYALLLLLLRCSAFCIWLDAGGTETGFYLLHIMQRVAYAQPVDGKVTVLAEYFITGQRIVQIAELDKEGFPQLRL